MERHILVIDDSATLRASVNYTLSEQGYRVIEAVDGLDGLEKLDEAVRQGRPVGMIIVDVNMPRMDGITFVKEVKRTAHRFIPVLIMTTESQESRKMEGRAAGAAGWLVKPFQPEQLVGVVKKFVRADSPARAP